MTPTLIDDIDHDNRAVQEEIFGPVQEIFTRSDYDEMIELANDVDYGLAAGITTNDLTNAYETAIDIETGNIWVSIYNDFPASPSAATSSPEWAGKPHRRPSNTTHHPSLVNPSSNIL